MERERITADRAHGKTSASTLLKRLYLLSSKPAIAGGLWRFAPLPGFSFLFISPCHILIVALSMACIGIGILLDGIGLLRLDGFGVELKLCFS